MKSFKQFLKTKVAPIIIPVAPTHGAHSKKKPPILIPVAPMHGAHATKRKLKEEATPAFKGAHAPKTEKVESWDKDHSLNHEHGRDEHAISHKLNMTHEEWEKHPKSGHIYDYTCHSSDVNHHLLDKAQGRHSRYDADPEHIHAKTKGIDTALHHAKMKHDLHVYHGANFNPDELAKQHPERHIKSAAYLSTTHDKHTARAFSMHQERGKRHVLHIHIKKGDHAMFVGRHSEHPHEHETLIPRDTTLKVHHEPTVLSDGTKVWHAHIHHQETHPHD